MPVASRRLRGGAPTELMIHHNIDCVITFAPCQGPNPILSGHCDPDGGREPPWGRVGRSSPRPAARRTVSRAGAPTRALTAVSVEAESGA